MNITYKETKIFTEQQIEQLFLSVEWESAKYPQKIVKGLENSTQVISAWDGDKLVGLVRGIDDGATVAFVHYLLVNPKYQGCKIGKELMERIMRKYADLLYVKVMPSDPETMGFYRKFGFEVYDNYSAMVVRKL